MIKDTCVVLCGGKSSRMGFNKVILPFGDYRLITYQTIKLSQIFSNIVISLKESKKDEIFNILYDDISKYNAKNPAINTESIQIVTEDLRHFSPLFGILNCFEQLHHSSLFFIPIDCPFIKFNTISTIIDHSENYDVIYARDSVKLHPLIGVWKSDIKDKIAKSLEKNQFKIIDFLSLCDTKSICFDAYEFINLNTKQDYRNAIEILKESYGTE